MLNLKYSSGEDPSEFKGNSSDVFSSISKTLGENVSAAGEATSFTAYDFVIATLWETVTLLASSNIPTSVTTDTTVSHIDLCKATSTADVKSSATTSTTFVEDDTTVATGATASLSDLCVATSLTSSDATTSSYCSHTATHTATYNNIHPKAGLHKEDAGWFSVAFRKATTAIPAMSTVRTSAAPWASPRNRTLWDQLEDMKRIPITDDNVEEVSEELADLTEDSEDMTAEEVDSTADILQNITAVNSSEPAVTRSVVETVNNLMNVNEDELEEAAAKGSTNRAIRCLETQLQIVDVTTSNGTYKDVQPNLGVHVSEYSYHHFQTGLTFIYAIDDPRRPLSPEHIFVYIGNSGNIDPGDMPIQARISLPTSLGRRIRRNSSRVSFVIYRTTALFLSPSLIEFNANQTDFSRKANTRVISASIDSMPISNLSEPVVTSYHPIFTEANENIDNVTNPVCVFWEFDADEGHGNWSRDGCRLTTSGFIHEYKCQCDHLTNFAILMDIYGNTLLTDYQDYVLEIMSYVGCCLSSVCLGLTLLTFLSSKKLRKSQANRILASLSASLLSLYITFLLLLSLNHVTMVTCGVIVGFLHYSLLSSACWMAVESFNMYLMVIRVFDRGGIPHFMLRAAVFALGTPAMIVGITSGIARQRYMSYSEDRQCGFLTLWPLVGGVLVPLAILILYDALIFALVMRRLTRKVAGKQITKPKYIERLRRLHNAMALIVLMGLTWGVGYLTSIQVASLAFQIIFIILNSLQGVYLFLFYCLRNPIARTHWRNLLCPRRMPSREKATVVSTCSSSSGNRSRPQSGNPGPDDTPDDEGKKPYDQDVKWYRKIGIDFCHVSSKQRRADASVYTIELSPSLPTSVMSKKIPYDGVFAFDNDAIDDMMEQMEHVY
eukprot:XP_011662988.1 PREDICTED: G-protein coupled receptor 126-like [Strongylocentrotus purpuratus]